MRRLLTLSLPLLLAALLLAPPAVAEEGDEGWSDEQAVPVEKEAPAAAEGVQAPTETERPAAGRPSTYYQKRPEGEPGAQPPEDEDGQPAAAQKPFVMPTESTVIGVRKVHNAPWVGNWLALELDMGFAVVGQAGKHVGATVTFYEADTERPLRAAMQPYVDAAGNLSVYTQLVPVQSGSRLFRAKLKIPYRAFPWPTTGPTYAVEARVRLMSRDESGAFSVLARSTTGFSIHYEKGCGCQPPGQLDCSRCAEWKWDFMYTWCKIWGDDMGVTTTQVPCLPPPKGTGRRADWFKARWRTRGSHVDEFQRRMDRNTSTPTAPR